MKFTVSADQRVKIEESEKRNNFLDLARELRKLGNMRVTVIPIVIVALEMVLKGLKRGPEELEIGDHSNYSIVGIGHNSKKSPGDLKKLAVTQTPVKDHQLMLMGETSKV